MDFELITVAQDAGIATLTLNRPKQLNAVSMKMAKEVMQACDELEEDPTVELRRPERRRPSLLRRGRSRRGE